MKTNKAIIISITVSLTILLFALSLCTTNQGKVNLEREAFIGTWKITEASYNTLHKVRPSKRITTLIELHEDSTAVFYYGENHEKSTVANWSCQGIDKLAYDEFGVSKQHDIIISSKKWGFGMLLENSDGKMTLNAREYSFEKI